MMFYQQSKTLELLKMMGDLEKCLHECLLPSIQKFIFFIYYLSLIIYTSLIESAAFLRNFS